MATLQDRIDELKALSGYTMHRLRVEDDKDTTAKTVTKIYTFWFGGKRFDVRIFVYDEGGAGEDAYIRDGDKEKISPTTTFKNDIESNISSFLTTSKIEKWKLDSIDEANKIAWLTCWIYDNASKLVEERSVRAYYVSNTLTFRIKE